MIHFDLPKQKSSIIKVLGVGGGGSNAVNYMFAQDIEGVDFIICNTDAKALEQSHVHNKIQLGPHLTQGLGAGANPMVGKQATEESLEEIKRIMEVNTKMAFICVGMGGGTGTGGAPIIAKICRELGILTVAIVTTPFGFEGPRRLQQAEHGIKELEPYVDTLLVISNDKLRMQYGNLKMKEAFGKADNVLATAAKCITDIINSRGHIIVDFADVCTVMKNGGVAILGKSEVEGEDRAQRAIEEALNSPLLNDNDIRGAKWILININSAEGEHECTMDELEIINNHLRSQAGEITDVIVGMGYDNTLDKKIGITLVATGFEHKDPFTKPVAAPVKKAEVKEEKITMVLGVEGEEKKLFPSATQSAKEKEKDPFLPTLTERSTAQSVFTSMPYSEPIGQSAPMPEIEDNTVLRFELFPEVELPKQSNRFSQEEQTSPHHENPRFSSNGGFLHKPSNIYNENAPKPAGSSSASMPAEPAKPIVKPQPVEEQMEFKLVIKDTPASVPPPNAEMENHVNVNPFDEEFEHKKRAAERIQKLRNLSFNMNTADAANEFDTVPAYVRRNMDLFGNTLSSVESYYSKHTVKKDDNNETHISSINSFLDGKKPD